MLPLRIQDIFLQSTEFRPTEPVEPFPIPRDPDSPELFKAILTFDEFRAFWGKERVVSQWDFRSEGGYRDISNQNGSSLLPIYMPREGGRGKPRAYDWSFRFLCRRHRPPKELSIQRASVGANCPVYIRMKKPVCKDEVLVEYFWRHNHDISARTRAQLPVGNNELNWTRAKVAEGLDWKGIKNQLRPSDAALQQLELGQMAPPPSMLISYEHVRKAVYRQQTNESRKAGDVTTSVRLWMDQIIQEGGKSKFEEQIGDNPNGFFIAWSTSFQLKIIKDNDTIACMDSTHRTVKSVRPSAIENEAFASAYLFTILVKDRNVQRGIPVAFMICGSESIDILRKWLTWLKTDCGLKTSKFMVDCSVIETEALKQVFPNVSIYYCSFHVGQAWERKMKQLHPASDWNNIRPYLQQIRTAESAERLETAWVNFKDSFPGANRMIQYLEKWMVPDRVPKWVAYMRENYQHIDTNNLVESWHRTLKRQHLGNGRDVRPDRLIFILHGQVNTDFRVTYYKIKEGLLPMELSEYDKKRKAKAMLSFEEARNKITALMDEGKFLVKSFTQPNTEYSVAANMDKSLLLSCTCVDYIKHVLPCKHIYLVPRIYRDMEINYGNYDDELEPEEPQDIPAIENNSTPTLESLLSPQLRLQLQARRAEREEAEKRAREAEIREEFEECERMLEDALNKMSEIVRDRRKRRCTLQYFQSTLAGVESRMHSVKGLNAARAGRTCQ